MAARSGSTKLVTHGGSLAGPSPLPPYAMTAAERLDEIATILALGLMRLRLPKPSTLSADQGESWVDFSPDQSGHAPAHDSAEHAP